MPSLFISDLHLQQARPDITRALEQFLTSTALQADRLYILGDLFEVWIGDDDRSDFNEHICSLLKRFTDTGRELLIIVGNRDFLLGESFAERCGAKLLPDLYSQDLHGIPTLLMHGDSLCTRDQAYMEFRQQSRSPQWQQQLLSQPLEARRQFAKQARTESQSANQMKAADIMDVTPAEVDRKMAQYQARLLIHGHTHRPARHKVAAGERIVLGDWDSHIWWLEVSDQGTTQLTSHPLQNYIDR